MSDDLPPDTERFQSSPPADLPVERETFVKQLLRKGVEATDDVLAENRALRQELERTRNEMALLRSQLASDDAIRQLLVKIESLELERKALLKHSLDLEQAEVLTRDQQVQVEGELHDLANLYIAANHLHGTLDGDRVVRHLKELLQQLVGAEAYVIYLCDESGERAHPLTHEGVKSPVESIDRDAGTLGVALETGLTSTPKHRKSTGSIEEPIAIIPFSIDGKVMGLIAILSVFDQKTPWAVVDKELFKFLSVHAATALMAAKLYSMFESDDRARTNLSALLPTPPTNLPD